MNDNDIPKRLQRAMQDAGLVNPRSDRPSLNAWKRESGVHTSTISRFVKGGTTLPANVQKMADALGVSVADLHSMTGRTGPAPWSPPQGTEALTARQRAALSELVLAFIEEDKGAAHDREDDTEPGPEAGGTQHSSQGSSPDGGTPSRPGAPISDLQRERDRRQQEADAKPLEDLLGLAADKGERMDDDE